MQIIVFLNTRFEQFSCDGDITGRHRIVNTVRNNLQQSVEISEVPAPWSYIYDRFRLEKSLSPAKLLAKQLNNDSPHLLMATPVRIQLGIRASETHLIPESHLPDDEEINEFNEYFSDSYRLEACPAGQYLLSSSLPMDISLDKSHWAPSVSDFTLQMLTADSRMRKFHTDVQTWCHANGLNWNGLYLWGQGQKVSLPPITVKTDSEAVNPYYSLHTHAEAERRLFCVSDISRKNDLLTECEFHLTTTKNTRVEFVFSDMYSISVGSRDQIPWIKRIFRRK